MSPLRAIGVKPVYIMFFLAFFLSLGFTSPSETNNNNGVGHVSKASTYSGIISGDNKESSPRGINRVPSDYNPRAAMTCNNFPRICHDKGSRGPDCCRRQCVNVMTDRLNCWQCGKRCKYGEACCGGRCVNVMSDRKNCGGCQKRCKKGSYCRYGMCSYA